MRVLGIARHPMLSQHIAALCTAAGAECQPVVGMVEGMRAARISPPDVVLCEVDLLFPDAMRAWDEDPVVASVPLLAVSLTRRQNESPILLGAPVAGYLYLPTLDERDLARALAASCGRGASAPADAYRWSPDAESAPIA
jgi:hypothetical protein